MTPEQRKKFNTLFGGVLLGIGIIAWMLSIYFAVSPSPPAPAPVANYTVDLRRCQMALTELGYQATENVAEVTLSEPMTANPKEQLERASIAAGLCYLPMHSFCMGDGCEKPGLTMVLRRPVEVAPPLASAQAPSASLSKAMPTKSPALVRK